MSEVKGWISDMISQRFQTCLVTSYSSSGVIIDFSLEKEKEEDLALQHWSSSLLI
jgi:hypothetical protein